MSHELIIHWLNLRRAIKRAAEAMGEPLSAIVPSQSGDSGVKEAWDALTKPQNLDALVDWREGVVGNEQDTLLVDEAIRHCESRIGQ